MTVSHPLQAVFTIRRLGETYMTFFNSLFTIVETGNSFEVLGWSCRFVVFGSNRARGRLARASTLRHSNQQLLSGEERTAKLLLVSAARGARVLRFVNVNTDSRKLARRRREIFGLFWPILSGKRSKVVQNRVLLGSSDSEIFCKC